MNTPNRSVLPWAVAAVFAIAFAVSLLRRPGVASRASNAASGHDPNATASASPAPGKQQRKIRFWVDPMHPAYKSDKPGTAPDCGMELVPVYEDASGAVAEATPAEGAAKGVSGYATISLPPERVQAIGVRLGKAEARDLVKTIRTVGRVTFDETHLHRVHTKFEGYVEHLYVDYTGKPVRKGQPLLSIYSPDLFVTQQEYLLAYRARQQLRDAANPDIARGSSDLYESARQRLLLWDIRPSDIERLEKTGKPEKALTLYSPVDGFVMAKNVVEGARVMPSDSLFEIAWLHHVWVLADIYESEARFVSVGQTARMTLAYQPGRTWTGKVTFIAPVLDEKTRTVRVRLEFENPDGTLKPEMYADIALERPLGRVVTVPDGAVLLTGTRALVFVSRGGGRFEPREVKTGARVDSSYEIREGVRPGEEVVTQANFLIDSESRLKAALAGMTSDPGTRDAVLPSATRTAAPAHQH